MDKYVKVAKIGQGSFGSAFIVTKKGDLSSKKYVIKEIRVDPRDLEGALREAKLLAALDHPNIIGCKESFMLPTAAGVRAGGRREQILCIVTEFADGGDLRKAIQPRQQKPASYFQENEILDLFLQVCLALKHLHDRKIIHRDIKPENIFLASGNIVKLGDFGVATVLSHTLASAETLTGTPYYTSPEICLGKRYNSKTDVWSLGCVLYELATFTHPFDGRSQRQLFDNIIRANYTPIAAVLARHHVQYSPGLSALVSGMLMKNPRDRPSVSNLLKAPIVMARIQKFLSDRALADELNHTVLHGHDIFRKELSGLPATSTPATKPQAAQSPPALVPPPAPLRLAPKERKKQEKPQAGAVARVRIKNAVLLRSKSFKKRAVPNALKSVESPFKSPSRAKKISQAVPIPAAKAVPAAAKVVDKKSDKSKQQRAPVCSSPAEKQQPKSSPSTPAVAKKAAVASKPPRGAVAKRVAQFNAQWQAQRQELLNHIIAAPSPPITGTPPEVPPPAPIAAVSGNNTPAPRNEVHGVVGREYPKPVEIQVQGRSMNSSMKQANANKVVAGAKKKVPPARSGIRQHIQAKKKEVKTRASPLDDPIILVQNLPDLEDSEDLEGLPSLHEDTSATKDTKGSQDDTPVVHPWPVPASDNLEFERMVLQLRSVVESANDDTEEAQDSDGEGSDGDESRGPGRVDDTSAPPPYATSKLEMLDIAVLEQETFRRALHAMLVNNDDPAYRAEALANVAPAHRASLLWMHDFIGKIGKVTSETQPFVYSEKTE